MSVAPSGGSPAGTAPALRGPGVAGRIDVSDLTASYHGRPAVTDVSLSLEPGKVTALIGPSGCGKSTLLRCMNGLHMTVPGASVTGQVLLDGTHIYDRDVDLVQVRRHVGMVFQRPNPFPTMSIADNVTAGLRFGPRRDRRAQRLDEVVEQSLMAAGLWHEVKDRLDKPGASLSGGQQQRLCIARCLAVEPQVLLMDEPCSALDPVSTEVIEGLIRELKREYTVVIVTHNMQQAARVSDITAFMTVLGPGLPGRLVEAASTKDLFSQPTEQATMDYITGKVG
ncbi:MAG: phosphate ABC transporter ATP-binding protein PstB [Streptosporangiaceae bacterium]